MDWLDLLAVQGTLKSLLQHHSLKSSILLHSAFFIVQLSHPYMTTGRTIALTRWTFVVKVISLLLNMLSRLVITFLPRSKHLLISWLQSQSAVILEPPKNKVCHCFHCLPIYLPWSNGTKYHELSFLNAEFWNWKYIILLQRRENNNILHHTATFWALIDADLVKVSSKCPCTVARHLFTQELHSRPLVEQTSQSS